MNSRDSQKIRNLIRTLQETNTYLASSEELSLEVLSKIVTKCLATSENIFQALVALGEDACYQVELTTYRTLLKDFLVAISQTGELAYPAEEIGACLIKMTTKLGDKHKKQVVFLPYKASMWDALASIYEAALTDPACDAYVIPIPYFTKDENGKLKDFHYEGDLFPSNVKITSWQDYPLAQKHPDVIYIHNPYDANNKITTVLPAFYSDKLKQYTNLLVYVPYFVSLHEQAPAEYPLAIAQGFANANLVCAQDKVIKAGYEEVWTKFAQTSSNFPKEYLGKFLDKIVALGSPKYDALNKATPENYPLPADWRAKIYRPDGTKKRVVFYNNTILEWNIYGKAMFAKYVAVFNFFLEHGDDYLLIWRPHPLFIDNIRSMQPNFLPDYLRLVELFKKSQLGIYDDSPDFYLAYTYADAFYGDLSSMAELFRKLGRPVIQQLPAYETNQASAEFDLTVAKEYLAKQEVIRESELLLAKLADFLATTSVKQVKTNYHFGADIHQYVMKLLNKR